MEIAGDENEPNVYSPKGTRKCEECGEIKALTLENFQNFGNGFRKYCRLCGPEALKEKMKITINQKYHVDLPVDLEYHEVKPGTKTKICSGCKRVLSVDDFHKNKSRADGYSATGDQDRGARGRESPSRGRRNAPAMPDPDCCGPGHGE